MIEHLNYSELKDREVFLFWNDSWYRIPFFVLHDLYRSWAKAKRNEEAKSLFIWFTKNEHIHGDDAVPEIKKILESEMNNMYAYKYYSA